MHKMVVCVCNIKALVLTDVWVYVVNKQKYNILLYFILLLLELYMPVLAVRRYMQSTTRFMLYYYNVLYCCVVVYLLCVLFAPSFLFQVPGIEWRN